MTTTLTAAHEAVLENLPRHLTFSEMADACKRRFGERAWSRSRIVRYGYQAHPAKRGKRSRLTFDAEVRSFVEDRLGRLTLDTIVAECCATFGPERAPSRSAVHRHWKTVRRAKKPE